MSISLFFTAWNLDPVRTWLSPRKLGIVRISAESFTAADTFYESSHFPKPNSSALKKTCRNISASSKCTADQYYQFLVLGNDRNWYFQNRPLSLGRPDTRTWNYTIETSRLISFFRLVVLSLNGPFFLSVQNYQSNPNIYETNTWPKHTYLKVFILQHLFHLRLQKYKSVFTMYLQVHCGY